MPIAIPEQLTANGNLRSGDAAPQSDKASYGSSTLSSPSPSSPSHLEESQNLLWPLPTAFAQDGWQTPPITSPSIDVSHKARYGSGPPSPILKGMQDQGYVALPWPKGSTREGREREGWESEDKVRPRINTDLRVVDELAQLQTDAKAAPATCCAGGACGAAVKVPDSDPKPKQKNYRVIAVDFDDVCAQFIPTITAEHNLLFGTDLTVEDVQTYSLFQNKGWGTMADTARKMTTMDKLLPKTLPVPGFAEGLRKIRALGHPIHIVTARAESSHDDVVAWLKTQGITVGTGEEDAIAHIWFTDSYGSTKPAVPPKGSTASADEREKELNEQLKEVWVAGIGSGKGGKSKLRVLRAINAALFIDDHHGNLEPIITADPPVQCLLFGKYTWNRSRSGVSSPVELMTFEERLSSGLALPMQEIEEGAALQRAEDWEKVVEWVQEWDAADARACW